MATPTYDELLNVIKAAGSTRTKSIDDAIAAATSALTTGYGETEGRLGELQKSDIYNPAKQSSIAMNTALGPTSDIIDAIIATEQAGGGGWTPASAGAPIVESAWKSALPSASSAAREARAGAGTLGGILANLPVQKAQSLADLAKIRGSSLNEIQAWETGLLTNAMQGERGRQDQLLSALLPYMSPEEVSKAFPGVSGFNTAISRIQKATAGTGGSTADVAAGGGGRSTGSDLQSLADMITLSQQPSLDPNRWSVTGSPYSFTTVLNANKNLQGAIGNATRNLNTSTRKRYF